MDKTELPRKLAPFLANEVVVSWEYEKEPGSNEWNTISAPLTPKLLYRFLHNTYPARKNFVPHLYSFSALTTPMPFRGGEAIPAVEVAKLAYLFGANLTCEQPTINPLNGNVFVECPSHDLRVVITPKYDVILASHTDKFPGRVENQVAIIDLLREMHFSVGFSEGEYIEKAIDKTKEVQP